MRQRYYLQLLLVLAVTLMASSSAFAQATIVIQNNDAAGVGFNDPTPVGSVGGNNGSTLGQQRLNAFQFAANIWGATLTSGPTIVVRAQWVGLPCDADSAVLGSAGTIQFFANFPNAPFPNTWYSNALANKFAGTDLSSTTPEINATFNVNIGKPGCFQNSPWYLGFDNNHGNGIDLVSVLVHEFSHGLGFQTFTDKSTGALAGGRPSIYDKFLFDNSTGKTWEQMTDSERVASAINTNHLTWIGAQVINDIPNVLAAGTPRLRVNQPVSIAGDYSVGTAVFGPPLSSSGVTNNVSSTSPADGCTPIANSLAGRIAFIDRGTCTFIAKVKNAQNAGAIGVIIGNIPASPDPETPPGLGGTDPTITIPSVGLNLADANTIRGQLASNINATMFLDLTTFSGADGARRALMYAPRTLAGGSSVSHWDTSASPNQLMEPNISADLTHNVIPPNDLTFSLLRDIGWAQTGTGSPTIQFAASSQTVNEAVGAVNVLVTRLGNASSPASVSYATNDSFTECNQASATASARCDYATTGGTLQFAAGETSKTILVSIVDDGYTEGSESFTMSLSNASGASIGSQSSTTITISANDTTPSNPFDTNAFFVRQQYLDFLLREPDAGGFNDWLNVLNNCQPNQGGLGSDPACDRVFVSSGFFRSTEFGERGYWAYRYYHAALGRRPQFAEFVPAMRRLSGFLSPAQEEAARTAFVADFMAQPEFTAIYGTPNAAGAAGFISTLEQRAQVTLPATVPPTQPGQPPQYGRQELIDKMSTGQFTAAQTLRAFIEQKVVFDAFFYRAFVAMQYFGYLLRDPEDAGYNDWVDVLTNGRGAVPPGDFRHLIFGFIYSVEYRQRFGP